MTHPEVNNLSGKPKREMQKVLIFPASKKTPLYRQWLYVGNVLPSQDLLTESHQYISIWSTILFSIYFVLFD